MILYWLLFGFAAMMALAFPVIDARQKLGPAQTLALLTFLVAYVLLAGLRYKIGGDWDEYDAMYDTALQGSLWEAVTFGDPAFGLLLWVAGRLGLGIYLVNGVCAALLGYGVIRIAIMTREPWLAITAAVPYLLIVVGMGYVRQAAAIGMILIAVSSLKEARHGRTLGQLALAAGFHSTAGITFPLIGQGVAGRNGFWALLLTIIGTVLFAVLLSRRFELLELGYIDSEYESGGALVRLLMSVVPSVLLLLQWPRFPLKGVARSIWLSFALANIVALVALEYSPSSTAVDRMALYFSPIQMVVFGTLMDLLGVPQKGVYLVRTMAVALAAAVQGVWLILATHADLWVPYHSILEGL